MVGLTATLLAPATWIALSHPHDRQLLGVLAFDLAALCLAGYFGARQTPTPAPAKKPPAEAASRWSTMVRAIPDVLIHIGPDHQVLDLHCPAGSAKLVAWATANFSGAPIDALHPVIQAARGNGFALADLSAPSEGLSRIEVRAVADSPDEVLLMLRDGSDREQLERRLVDAERERLMAETRAGLAEADRLAALGTLAAGVAHEVNNPLAYISANLDFALNELKAGTPDLGEIAAALRESAQGAARVRAIIRDMHGLSRRSDPSENGVFSIPHAIEAAVNLVRTTLKTATLETKIGTVLDVRGSESRLCQVLVNLIMNAGHAMPQRPSAENKILISVETAADASVLVRVADNGSGMSEEVKGRVFDTFFTTKPPGIGTGLGLPISRTIVESMGGTLTLDSEPGKGTTVTARFPSRPVNSQSQRLRLVSNL